MLAINGGEPVSKEWIYLTKPLIGQEERDEVMDTLDSVWLSRGPKVTIFENKFAEYMEVPYAVATSSCTASLHISNVAAGVKDGDEVITSPITFPATANAIVYERAKPVFVDVDPKTFNIDVSKIEEKITEKTKAIVPVHIAGQSADMDEVLALGKKYGIKIIEDSAHGAGAYYKGKHLGSIGDAGCFSLYASKNITTGDGGMITVREDGKFAEFCRVLSLHGISSGAWKRYSKEGSPNWELIYPGFKYSLTDIQAAIGIHQVPRIDMITAGRTKWANTYKELLKDVEEITLPYVAPDRTPNWHLFILKLNLELLKYTRDEIFQMLKAENIGAGIHFVSVHKQPWYQKTFDLKDEDYPVATWLSDRLISLPLFPQMTENEVELVVKGVKKVLDYARK